MAIGRPGLRRRGREVEDGPRAGLAALVPYFREHRGILAVVIVLSLFAAAAQLAQPLVVGQVIERVQNGETFSALVAGLIGLVIAAALLGGLQHYLLQRTGTAIVRSARRSLARHLLILPIREYDVRRTGDLVSRVGSDTTLLYAVVTQGLVDSVGGAFVLLGALTAMFIIDPVLLGSTLAVIVVAVVLVVLVSGRMRKASRIQQERVGDVASSVERALSAIRTVRATGAAEREAEAIVVDADRAYRAGLDVARYSALVVPVAGIALQLSLLMVLGFGGFRVASGELSVAQLVSFIIFLFLIIGPLGSAFGAISSVNQALGALGRIQEVLEVPGETAHDAESARLAAPDVAAENAIEFDGVSFGYDADRLVLSDVSFAVPRGSRLALVGPSGAGKSTTLALIERFYDPSAGVVRLGGRDLRAMERGELRAQLGYVEQEAPVLSGTLRDNLTLGAPEASDADCDAVLRSVNLGAVLDRDPRGLEAPVGEDGVMLSGGERQRLAIARTLLQAAPILLLDESTSSLDGVNELLMRQAIDAVAENRTLVVIAHRLSTVIDSDVIVVLNHGKVEGIGTHAELLEASSLYRELAETQLLT